jgi:predicted enzyme involved in methoxymalonyl-ACP biosynthesis
MGDYGLIGVIFCRSGGRGAWEIDTWLMSCRVLGRQMEKFMFDRLIEAAQAAGIDRIVGVFRPTAKNVLVRDLYDHLGFVRIGESAGEVRYELQVPREHIMTATHVRNVSSPAVASAP